MYMMLRLEISKDHNSFPVSHPLLKVHSLTNAKCLYTPLLNLSSFCLFVSHYIMLSLTNFLPQSRNVMD